MSQNLIRRVFTSLLLLSILLISLFLNNYSWLFLLIIASVISFFEFNKLVIIICKKKKSSNFLLNVISFFYLIFFTYSAFYLGKIEEVMLYVLLVCIFSDIGGYAIGKLLGGRKLIKISPNKTISGCIGSFLFSLIPYIILILIKEIPEKKIYSLFFTTLFLSFICQAGDLFISYFKRKAKVKDTGTILPGHGGLLDRIDGIIFAVPGAYILDQIFF